MKVRSGIRSRMDRERLRGIILVRGIWENDRDTEFLRITKGPGWITRKRMVQGRLNIKMGRIQVIY